mgnify:CR=1 FL=1
MIELKNIHKTFDDREILKGISTVFEKGKTNLIIGQSGSGKTVLMKCIVGLFEPTGGEVLYDGRNFFGMSKKERTFLRREMGMIFQNAALFDSMTVLDNVRFPLDMFSTLSWRDRQRKANECLERVNLKGAESKLPGEKWRYAKACGNSKSHINESEIPLLRRTKLRTRPQNLTRD